MKKIGIWSSSFVLLFLLSGFGYYSQVYLPGQVTPEPGYNTTRVRSGDITISTSGVGNVYPGEKVSVGFQVNGVLAEVRVKVGDVVDHDQVLARLDDRDALLKLRQAELALGAYYAPDTIHQAEIAQLNAKSALETAINQLKYLISPQVYYWETALQQAQAELDELQTKPDIDEAQRQAAQNAVDKADLYLKSAQKEYYASYVWSVFPYSYKNETTGETVDSYLEPSPDAVSLARLKVKTAALALNDAEAYLYALQAGQEGSSIQAAYAGTSLNKLEQARLDLESAQSALEKTKLIAPVAGTVTSLSATAGQAIGTSPFLTIETLDQMALRFFVEESDLHYVKVGNPVVISFEAYPDNPVEGQVTYLEPALQTVDGNLVGVVWAALPDSFEFQLLSGMSADVEVIAGRAENTLLVPVQALRELAPGSYAVFVVQADGSLKLTPVRVGLKDYANAQILSGLKAGDVVSTGGVETK